jgi:hypothetical protein
LYLSTTAETWAVGVWGHSKGAASGRAPDVLFVVIVL